MVKVKKLTLDILLPKELHIIELSSAIASDDGVDEVKTTVVEVDAKTETVKMEVYGSEIDYDRIFDIIREYGAVLRSIDEVIVSNEV